MIKLFRKIRQQLLSENKFTKHLLYALGEIVLVVIGILIALQINNANEEDKLRKKEFVLLSEMATNLRTDQKDLEFNIQGNAGQINANQVVLNALENRLPMHDSLKQYYADIFGNYQLSENTAAWETLKSIGLDLISNDSLRVSISHLYTVRYQYLENLEKGLDDKYQWDVYYPQILENINMTKLWDTAEPVDHSALMDNRKFIETLRMNLFFRKWMQGMYTKINDEVSGVIQQIDDHLNTIKESE
jgi:hypothetical protein